MKRLATLFTCSYGEFRSTRTITTAAMLGAVSVVLGYFSVQLGDYIRISFSTIANQLVYYLFGTVFGCVFGGVLDVLKYLIKPTGGFFPGFTLSAAVAGALYGVFYYRKPVRLWRVLAAELVVAVICNMFLGTLWLSMLYGKAFMVLLPMRVVKNLIMWPVNSALFYVVVKTMEETGAMRMIRGERGSGRMEY